MAKNIMFQGTGSTVGKSLLTAAICRILKEDHYNVAPFKSQNMALNSFITKNGKEMGRAQVVQAEAAKIDPMVEMNPILLKPTSDVGSQVIVNGEVYKNMSAKVYHQNKSIFKEKIKKSYEKLDSMFDVIVLEGAGSPAEINLKENDLVNMGMAEMVDAPVIIVGDIDKGGVFASIYGTIMLLEPHERERVKGYIINKFRGDVNLLTPGIKMFEEKINVPCLGVVPYMDINIDDEDSVTTRFINRGEGTINIGIIRLPYMSNFTDFTPLEFEKDVNVKYIKTHKELNNLDLIIIPGSKNTLGDMKFIHESGMDGEIYREHKRNVPIIGICGGYQILGREIIDQNEIESSLERMNGLSLLDVKTSMKDTKQTKQVQGRFITELEFCENLEKNIVTGYEIHMGETDLLTDATSAIQLEDGRLDGAMNEKGNVFGTYLHGIFENDHFRKSILDGIRKKKGMDLSGETIDYKELKEREYDKLALGVRENVDIGRIKKIIGVL